jgi:hypothetical protein
LRQARTVRLAAARTAGARVAAGRRAMSGHGSPEEILQQKGACARPPARPVEPRRSELGERRSARGAACRRRRLQTTDACGG